jgi:hypothetical protein
MEVGGQRHTAAASVPGNYIAERKNTDMGRVFWALAAVLTDGQKGRSVE